MLIYKVHIKGFRNYKDVEISLNNSSLIIGSNNVGKTNFIYALRLLFDRSLSENDLDLLDSDFKDDKVIAYVGCLIIPHIFNMDYIICHVLSLVIDKAFKNTRLFYRILKDLDLLAKDNNAKNISITFFDNIKEKNLIRLSYARKAKEYNKEL